MTAVRGDALACAMLRAARMSQRLLLGRIPPAMYTANRATKLPRSWPTKCFCQDDSGALRFIA
jgi:hypothetical protein